MAEKPCVFHKGDNSVLCECKNYKRSGPKILIIKLDAMGDVLRTTAILSPLKKKAPDSSIYWITKSNSVEILSNNPLIDKTFVYNDKSILYLSTVYFDAVYCFDITPESCCLTSIIKSEKYYGFVWNSKNEIPVPADKKAEYWYSLSSNDVLKKNNKLTYQQILLKTAGLKCENISGYPIHYYFTGSDTEFGDKWKRKNGFDTSLFTVGLNLGVGGKWLAKKWQPENYIDLIKLLKKRGKEINIIVFQDFDSDKSLSYKSSLKSLEKTGNVYVNKKRLTFRNYAVLLGFCDLIATSDTLAFHLAAAFGKTSVCLAGPTSATELENYGNGIIITSDKKKCLCCYKTDCSISPNCMDDITPETVCEKIYEKYL